MSDTRSVAARASGRRTTTVLIALLACVAVAAPAHAIKLVCYNILNYDGTSAFDNGREPHFKTVLNAIQADVVCVTEVSSATGFTRFRFDVLNAVDGPGGYNPAPFIDGLGGGGDNAMYFRPGAVTFVSNQNIQTQPAGGIRDWSMYRIRLAGYTGAAAEMYIFFGHLSASVPAQREIEADVYRDWAEANLPAGAHVVCGGDFNLDTSAELAWLRFTETRATNIGRLKDPINAVGTWASNAVFAPIHTQSPVLSQSGYVGGGVDDRFDFFLTSDNLLDNVSGQLNYRAGTYKAFGNDGQHFNKAITDIPVIPEGAAMATALYFATDHLPVVMEFDAPAKVSSPTTLAFGTVIVGAAADQSLGVSNPAPVPGRDLSYTLAIPGGYSGPAGPFVSAAGAAANSHTISMDTASAGDKAATLTINSNAPEEPARNVSLTGIVVGHAVPSTIAAGQVLSASLDFGTHPVGGFSDQGAAVHNAGYTALQAALEVYDFNLTGDARFSMVGFAPATVTGSPATFTVHFDDTGASGGVYNGTLTLLTRDDQALPGASNLSSITYNLQATVSAAPFPPGDLSRNGCVDAPDVPLLAALLLDPDAATPDDRDLADMDSDGENDGDDIQPFVDALIAGC